MSPRPGRALAVVAAAVLLPLTAGTASHAGPAGHAGPAAEATVAAAAAGKGDRLVQRIRDLGLVRTVRERQIGVPRGFRYFDITVSQPVEHGNPTAGRFRQRISLLHRSVKRPTVLYTSGYFASGQPTRSEPAQIVDGNEIEMEYRFFQPSRPKDLNPSDWQRFLTIEQAAADQHRIIEAFTTIYQRNWLSTGGSKGGMTATYHRRFYPDDVDGTVPYVAPNDVVDAEDSAWEAFFANVGGEKFGSCRERIVDLQRTALGEERAWFQRRFDTQAEKAGATYDLVGSRVLAFEDALTGPFFTFWQYEGTKKCDGVPGRKAANPRILAWIQERTGPIALYDADPENGSPFLPYYFQAAYQLGAAPSNVVPLEDVLEIDEGATARDFVPERLREGLVFDDDAMRDIDGWVTDDSTRMLYVYGKFDPWSAEPFTCDGTTPAFSVERDEDDECYRFYQNRGNHGSSIEGLPAAQRAEAIRLVRRWAGLRPATVSATTWRQIPALDDDWQRGYLRPLR